MTSPRFFCQEPLSADAVVVLPSAVSHHIRVRRLRAGQEIVVFDGSGVEFNAVLQFEKSGQAIALTGAAQAVDRELPQTLTLVQGIASQERMDWVVEKAVELGASALVPVTASRSVVKLSGERAAKRVAHWENLVIAASEQCGRNRLMKIYLPCPIGEAVKNCARGPMLLCHPSPGVQAINDPDIVQSARSAKGANLIVGPEGGWDETEVRQWLAAGAQAISLGKRVLRTETAGLAALSALSHLLA